ncbi:ribonuclease E/G [Candidatus Shikimatogenerans bostrichidophilus]|uniref:ribonuclease E/G n=1 Tax=Candidatus Shikimatogenerans bostrichidophilus TaxID=2943807 RepID=UPI0029667EE0
MNKVLVINVINKIIKIALLKKNKLLEYREYKYKKLLSVGDIFNGKINYISKGMKVAFIDIGYKKYGILHFEDLLKKNELKKNELKIGNNILVQILKTPINDKGPKLTSKIKIIGKYIILIPKLKKILISRKIKNNNIIKTIIDKVENKKKYGIIIRTLCKKNNIKVIKNEIKYLKIKNNLIKKNNKNNKKYTNNNILNYILKEKKIIICNNLSLYKKIINYLNLNNNNKIKLYNSNIPIFKKYGIELQKKILLGKKVYLLDGSNLIIEKTEALNVIDINSNMIRNNKNSLLEINLIAIKEIIRQIKLRNMAGIIIIDCINMKKKKYNNIIYEYLKKNIIEDNIILPPNKLNIIQIILNKKSI